MTVNKKIFLFIAILFFITGFFLLIKPIYFYSKGILFQEFAGIYWNINNKSCTKKSDNFFVGRLTIPGINLDNVVLNGTDNTTLSLGPGLFRSNFNNNYIVIAGHRDSFFKKNKNISLDDLIIFEDECSKYDYKVIDILSHVEPNDMSYFNSKNKDFLVLITCFPFDFVGPAPYRYLVIAEKVI